MTRLVIAAALAAGALSVAACGSSATPAEPAASSSTAAPASPAATLGPLTLAAFPSTTDGKLAKGICGQWAGLRSQYAARLGTDSATQLEGWLSGPAWNTEYTDQAALGNDPRYLKIEVAFGAGTVGDEATTADVSAMDKACHDGD